MSTSAVLITDMAVLVGIFLLGLLAKLFPKKTGARQPSEREHEVRTDH